MSRSRFGWLTLGGIALALWGLFASAWPHSRVPDSALVWVGMILALVGVGGVFAGGSKTERRREERRPLVLMSASTAALVGMLGLVGLHMGWISGDPGGHRVLGAEQTDEGLWAVTMMHGNEPTTELSAYAPGSDPTVNQLRAADELVGATMRASEKFADYDWTTTEGGFTVSNAEILGRQQAEFHHLFSPAYMRDEHLVDPERPESLMFQSMPDGGKRLVGVMFMAPRGEHGPQIGGPLTRWHYHPAVEFCMDEFGTPTQEAPDWQVPGGDCPDGTDNGPTTEMMHVWLLPNPFGVFTHRMAVEEDTTAAAMPMDHRH